MERLRYSEEHGVRSQAGELTALRRRVRKLVGSGKAPDFSEYVNIIEISSLGNVEHGLSFSMVDYVLEHKKEQLRDYVRRLGAPGSVDQFAVFRAAFDKSVPAFDEEWRQWVRKTYPKQ